MQMPAYEGKRVCLAVFSMQHASWGRAAESSWAAWATNVGSTPDYIASSSNPGIQKTNKAKETQTNLKKK